MLARLLMCLNVAIFLVSPFPGIPSAAGIELVREESIDLKSGDEVIGQFLSFSITDPIHADGSTEIIVASFAPSKTGLTIEYTDQVVHMADYFGREACPDSILVASGGFFAREKDINAPVGLIISEGKHKSPLFPWRWGGVFHFTDNRYYIHPIKHFQQSPTTTQAIQAKPILVRDGKNDMYRDDGKRWDRMSIGITGQNALVVFGAFSREREAISLYNFALAALEAADLASIKLRDLLALDGADGASLNIRKLSRHYGHKGYKYVPNVICVMPRTNNISTDHK